MIRIEKTDVAHGPLVGWLEERELALYADEITGAYIVGTQPDDLWCKFYEGSRTGLGAWVEDVKRLERQ